ncbi:MAG: hypothetical protein ACI9MC_001288, partial [Kiritimatiellia bacterium]
MSLVQRVSDELKQAMRAKDKPRVQALRSIRAKFIEALKEKGADDLPDSQCVDILRKQAKQRQESIEAFNKGGRPDLAETEAAELAVIDAFLPKLADEAQTRVWVQEAIDASGATSAAQMGKVMGH